ncbi:MAG: sulfotransferase [Myxococcales bacterium]|jgi:hypothetical protein
MTLKVIGTGLGRTGTYSLKQALNALELGPCYHMEEVIHQMPVQLPKWQAVAAGEPNWDAVFEGYESAVDWPTASYYRELHAAYPNARFVHTVRDTQTWVASFSETIQKLLQGKDQVPAEMRDWLEMCVTAIAKVGVTPDASPEALALAFDAHTDAVRAAIPAEQLLLFEVKQGWAPLCAFLGVPAPTTAFPRTNDRKDFWDRIEGAA